MKNLGLAGVLGTLFVGCWQTEERSAARDEIVLVAMGEHWADAAGARDALIDGDLARVVRLAGKIEATMPDDRVAPDLRPYRDEVVAAAKRAAGAHDVTTAAGAVGEMAYHCGECHSAGKSAVPIADPPEVSSSSGIPEEMARHRKAIEMLWAALVVPDDGKRVAATEVLATAPLVPSGTPADSPLSPLATELELGVHELAMKIARDEGPERGKHYGELLTTCATCHRLLRD